VYEGTEAQVVKLDGSSSTGCIVSYDWDIGNDGTYEYSSPSPIQSIIFAANGSYDIKLRVTDNTGSEKYATTTAAIIDSVPAAGFTATPDNGTAPLTVQFNNYSTAYDQPLTYEWDFTCDSTVDSSDENPSYIYEAGTYSVCLTVWDSDGSDAELTQINYITVNESECVNPPLKIGDECYETLQQAYDNAIDGAIIQSRDVTLTGGLNANRDISVSLEGGYNSEFTGKSGKTILNGFITLSDGTLMIGDFISQ
jgi:PKD repeat protein